jgi:hypothetical protein
MGLALVRVVRAISVVRWVQQLPAIQVRPLLLPPPPRLLLLLPPP